MKKNNHIKQEIQPTKGELYSELATLNQQSFELNKNSGNLVQWSTERLEFHRIDNRLYTYPRVTETREFNSLVIGMSELSDEDKIVMKSELMEKVDELLERFLKQKRSAHATKIAAKEQQLKHILCKESVGSSMDNINGNK